MKQKHHANIYIECNHDEEGQGKIEIFLKYFLLFK